MLGSSHTSDVRPRASARWRCSRPSTGAAVWRLTSAGVSIRRRNCSSASASRQPANRPSRPAIPSSNGGRGWIGEKFGDAGSTRVATTSLLPAIESWNARVVAAAADAASRGLVVRAVMRRMPVPASVEVSMSAVSLWPSTCSARARLTLDFAVSA